MKTHSTLRLAVLLAIALRFFPAHALASGWTGLSQQFLRDCESADAAINQLKSVEPLLALLPKCTNEVEQAYLEVAIGTAYGQRTGVVDPAQAVLHYTAALRHELPDRTYLEVLMWRGNAQEQLKKTNEALRDYLRGLVACSYYDLSRGWPEIQSPKVPIFINSPDPENAERVRDYNTYRKSTDFQRCLLMQRYYLVEAVKRVGPGGSQGEGQLVEILGTLSPDSGRFGTITLWLKSENKRPWP